MARPWRRRPARSAHARRTVEVDASETCSWILSVDGMVHGVYIVYVICWWRVSVSWLSVLGPERTTGIGRQSKHQRRAENEGEREGEKERII